MPAISVKASVEARMENSKRLRIVRAEPSALPDLESIRLEAAARETEREAEASGQAMQTLEAPEDYGHAITIGATIFENGVSHATLPDKAGNTVAAVCGFDLGLLVGIPGFRAGNTDVSLDFTPGFHIAARDGNPDAVGFPPLDVAPGAIVFPGGTPDPKILSDLEILRDFIAREGPRLIERREKLRIRQAAQDAWHAENPPLPKDETIWLRPHTGSRYLAETGDTQATGSKAEGADK